MVLVRHRLMPSALGTGATEVANILIFIIVAMIVII